MYSYFSIVKKSLHVEDEFNFLSGKINKILPEYYLHYQSQRMNFFCIKSGEKGIGAYKFPDRAGVLVGALFKGRDHVDVDGSLMKIDLHETNLIRSSNGNHLIKYYWGQYAVFIDDGDSVNIMSDPTGSLPIYYVETNECYILFSNMDEFVKLKIGKLFFNKDYIAASLRSSMLYYEDTGFEQIKKIYRGHCLAVSDLSCTEIRFWSPCEFCLNENEIDIYDAVSTLRNAVLQSTLAWSSQFNNILLRLSGGLDSSIILYCLAESQKDLNVICAHFYGSTPEVDERRFAETAAKPTGFELISIGESFENSNPYNLMNFRLAADIRMTAFQLIWGSHEKSLYDKFGAEASFGGHGGDNVFNQGADHSLDDFIRDKGINFKTLQHVVPYAKQKGITVWQALASAFAAYFRNPTWSFNEIDRKYPSRLLRSEISESIDLDKRTSRWMEGSDDLPPGKKEHLFNVGMSHWRYRPSAIGQSITCIEPFLHQPVIEAVLKIPTYLHGKNGIDRAVARQAFSNVVPTKIISRESKAVGSGIVDRWFYQYRKEIKEIFLDGLLVSEGFYDKELCERAFLFDNSQSGYLRNELFDSITVEAWMRRWQSLLGS